MPQFLPREAMLARYLCECAFVRPSVTSRYCIETTGRIELGFSMEASFLLSFHLYCKEILVSPK